MPDSIHCPAIIVILELGRLVTMRLWRESVAVTITWIALIVFWDGHAKSLARAEDSPAQFVRGLNLNGPAVVIDKQQWQGKDAGNYTCDGKSFDNQAVAIKPPTDAERAKMIRSSRWGNEIDVTLTSLSAGPYQVLLYVWEDNHSETFGVLLNEQTVLKQFHSGTAGQWKKLGPWKTDARNGTIKLSARGGAANFSGIEVWSGYGPIPQPKPPEFADAPTDEQLVFFEKRIRPLLVERCYECHSATAKELGGGLLLDSRPGIVKGGDSGPVLVPGDPESSLLMTAVDHTNSNLKMRACRSKGTPRSSVSKSRAGS